MPITGPVRVVAADTLDIEIDGQRVGVGVAGIVGPDANSTCGLEAIGAAKALVAEGIVLQEDLALAAMDAKRRRVYRVELTSGRSFAEELVRAGYAWPDPKAEKALERLSIVGAATEARS